ncbi:MAG TPA: hypothetical protein VK065_03040 [Brevibacterium sp.]|nr:hypothetical protein [Brevibacterium sp.]
MDAVYAFASGAERLLIFLSVVLVLVGCILAWKIQKGDVYHSVPWIPWLVPAVAWLVAALCGYLALA